MSRLNILLLLGAWLFPLAAQAQKKQRGEPRAAPRSTEAQSEETTEAKAEVRQEGDEKVKVYEFSGLDIEGQLKTPQMLYFLNRLRAEFGRPRLPHRSFMPELQRSTRDKNF